VRVPTDQSTLAQQIDVVRFTNGPPTGVKTNDFDRLACYRGVTGSNVIQTDIDVQAGDIIGILGARGTSTMYNSYGTAYPTEINGWPTTLTRMVYDGYLHNTLAKDLWTQSSYYGRVEMWYTTQQCPPATSPAVGGPMSRYGFCWYIADGGNTCDNVCAAVGGENLAYEAENAWPDACTAAPTGDDIVTDLFVRGNEGGWTGPGAGNGCWSLGWGWGADDGEYYGKCTTGTAHCGAYPSDPNGYPDLMPVCPCFQRAIFGPEHTFAGMTSEHFITQTNCSPGGNINEDAGYFCESFYGPDCFPRIGYVAHTTPYSTYPKMHKVSGCTSNGTAIPATWCMDAAGAGQQCKVGNWSENTDGVGNIVCECY